MSNQPTNRLTHTTLPVSSGSNCLPCLINLKEGSGSGNAILHPYLIQPKHGSLQSQGKRVPTLGKVWGPHPITRWGKNPLPSSQDLGWGRCIPGGIGDPDPHQPLRAYLKWGVAGTHRYPLLAAAQIPLPHSPSTATHPITHWASWHGERSPTQGIWAQHVLLEAGDLSSALSSP